MQSRLRKVLASLCTLAVFAGLPAGLTYRQVRQERLNRALIAAIQDRNAASVVTLLEEGADPNTFAVDAKEPSFWQRFLACLRAKPVSIPTGETALWLAIQTDIGPGEADPAIVKALIAKGANVNAQDELGRTPLLSAYHPCENSDCMSLPINDAIKPLLIEAGADVNLPDEQGHTVLQFACLEAGTRDVRLLLKHGANPNSQAKDGITPLLFAALRNNVDGVKLLLANGADVSQRDRRAKITALKLAKAYGHWKCVRLLKQAGAKE